MDDDPTSTTASSPITPSTSYIPSKTQDPNTSPNNARDTRNMTSNTDSRAAPAPFQKSWATGVCCIVLVAIIWTAATVIKKWVFGSLDFKHPFLVTLVCNSCFMLQFLTWICRRFLIKHKLCGYGNSRINVNDICGEDEEDGEQGNSTGCLPISSSSSSSANNSSQDPRAASLLDNESNSPAAASGRNLNDDSTVAQNNVQNSSPTTLTKNLRAQSAALLIAPFWFAGQCTYNFGVVGTSVTSSTVICTTSCVSTFLFSIFVIKEKATIPKWAGVGLCMLGNSILGLFSSDAATDKSPDSLSGDVLCWVSTLFYAIYSTLIAKYVTDPIRFFSFVGVYCFGFMLVSSPIVYYDGGNFTVIKEFFTAHNGAIPGVLILTGLLDNVLSQFFWAWGVLHTSPTVATIGLSLTIPLSILSDLTISAEPVCFAQYVAAVLVCGGFFVLTLTRCQANGYQDNLYYGFY